MTFSVDESEKLEINDSGINVTGNAVSGDLTVNGTNFSLQTTNSVVKDTIFELNNGATEFNTNDIGIVMERGTAGNNAFIGWDESADQFVVATTTATGESSGDLALDDANFRAANIAASALGVTGATTLTGALNANGGIVCDTDKFVVADTTGNTSIAGTLGVTGATTLSSTLGVTGATTLTGALNANGGILCDTDKFVVADTTGNTSIAGTLGVTGATTLTGALNANGGIVCDTDKL